MKQFALGFFITVSFIMVMLAAMAAGAIYVSYGWDGFSMLPQFFELIK